MSGEGTTRRGTEPQGASSPPEALTEDDEKPYDKSHDGEDEPPVADGLIVWGGGGEPSRRQAGQGQSPWAAMWGDCPSCSPWGARGTHSP